jgi:hypothetical protein
LQLRRRNLQGYTRCFRPQDYYSYQKLAESVVWRLGKRGCVDCGSIHSSPFSFSFIRCAQLKLRWLAVPVLRAEILFDERTNGAKDLRKRCVFASATLGLLLCLTLFPWPAVPRVKFGGEAGTAEWSGCACSVLQRDAAGQTFAGVPHNKPFRVV